MTPDFGFREFFQTATGKEDPYDYQRRLADNADLPELLDVPTGLGKTAAALLGWLWRRRFAGDETRSQTARRLVYCLPMRVLVEQTYAEAIRWLDRLGMLAGNAQWEDQAEKKGLRQYAAAPEAKELAAEGWARRHGDLTLPIAVHILMGGEDRTDWVLWPARDAILIGTQDMLLSRALNRGYAAGRARWPMEFGLLNNDCLWVFDEVQLMGSGLATSLQLQAWRESLRLRAAKDCFSRPVSNPVFGPAHSLWMSATTTKHWFEKAVDWRPKVEEAWQTRERLWDDEKRDGHVGKLFENSKRLASGDDPIASLKPTEKQDSKAATTQYLDTVAQQIQQKRAQNGVTLVIVNTVERATRLYELMHGPNVHLIHSRFRPHERQGWKPILDKENTTPRIIISTQVVEAGVDFSAEVMFTELAPWASLVQRFGRCARYPRQTGTIYWMDLEGEPFARPYEVEELDAARQQLSKLEDAGLETLTSLSKSLNEQTPEAREALFPYEPRFVPREKDLFDLFDTTPDLTGADIDISRFIRDGVELDVLVYWRDIVGEPSRGDRPQRAELCSVPFHRLRKALKALTKRGRIWRLHYREGWQRMSPDQEELVYSGQVFLLETGCGGYHRDLGWTGNPEDEVEPVPFPPAAARADEYQSSCDQDDSDAQSELPRDVPSGGWLTIREHCANVAEQLGRVLADAQIREAIDGVTGRVRYVLDIAARWHDRGKAHDCFQAKINTEARKTPEAHRLGGEPAAKAPEGVWPKGAWLAPRDRTLPRLGFRHELASALAAMETLRAVQPDHQAFAWPEGLERSSVDETRAPWIDASEHKALIDELVHLSAGDLDLLVYLIASHHGKVRMSLRSSPDDSKITVPDPCPGETPQARGVREGDVVAACSLPGPDGTPLRAPEVSVHLDPMSLGLSDRYGPSWRERTQALLERLGPFRLGYLEALLRAADWCASREERKLSAETPMVREEEAEYQRQLADAKEFVERWRHAGPALEEQRCRELQELDDEAARRMTLDLFDLWRPSEFDDLGGGLVEQQKVFAKLRQREATKARSR